MDLLFREYASPFPLIDTVIRSGRFLDWIEQFLESHKEKIQWEYWLHKVYDKTWSDYLNENKADQSAVSMTKSDLETTITNSFDILQNFVPGQKGGELNGFI